MALFQPAFSYMIRNEDFHLSGAVVPEPNGGKERFGINSEANPEAVADGFYTMTTHAALMYAESLYQSKYWNGRGLDKITSQQVASKLFDVGVNMGNIGVVDVLHRTHGVDSSHTVSSINAMKPATFLANFIVALKERYHAIVQANPDTYQKYLNGWLARADKLPPADILVTNPDDELIREA
jgi:lysozyme family protein